MAILNGIVEEKNLKDHISDSFSSTIFCGSFGMEMFFPHFEGIQLVLEGKILRD